MLATPWSYLLLIAGTKEREREETQEYRDAYRLQLKFAAAASHNFQVCGEAKQACSKIVSREMMA